mmetsp:Transcript_10124/g.22715  ORF Transcript_10124/g.22715 Transcript_10124/m.22715 type:complete len:424 (+) Transcript_10124:74-1345(+)
MGWPGQVETLYGKYARSVLLLEVLVASSWRETSAYSSFQSRLPNGATVPCPSGVAGCNNGVCSGVGHDTCAGGPSPKNLFGDAFRNAGSMWTAALCQADSDSDGISNGEELGDPCCVWQSGQQPAYSASSHPGFASSTSVGYQSCPTTTTTVTTTTATTTTQATTASTTAGSTTASGTAQSTNTTGNATSLSTSTAAITAATSTADVTAGILSTTAAAVMTTVTSTPEAEVITGTIVLSNVSDIDALLVNGSEALRDGIASIAGIPKEYVTSVMVERFEGQEHLQRRLYGLEQEELSGAVDHFVAGIGGRRLAELVQFTYSCTLPASVNASQVLTTIQSASLAAITSSLSSSLSAAGLSITLVATGSSVERGQEASSSSSSLASSSTTTARAIASSTQHSTVRMHGLSLATLVALIRGLTLQR